jgi:hypothetical protein
MILTTIRSYTTSRDLTVRGGVQGPARPHPYGFAVSCGAPLAVENGEELRGADVARLALSTINRSLSVIRAGGDYWWLRVSP